MPEKIDMLSDKLIRGFEAMKECILDEDQLALICLIDQFEGKFGPVFKRFFQDAFDAGADNRMRWEVINRMDDLGFIELERDHPRGSIQKFIIHPDTIHHLKGKYQAFYEVWVGPFHSTSRAEIDKLKGLN